MVISVSVATCRLDKLLSGPAAASFCQFSGTLSISAAQGSTTRQSTSFSAKNCGDGSLDWKGEGHKPWLSLLPDSGAASTDGTNVTVLADPAGMDTGTFSDTAVLNGVSVTTQLTVPVQFIIHPCAPRQIVPDQVYTDTVNAADCTTSHRSNFYAQMFSFSGTTNDVVSIVVNGSFDGYVVLDTNLTKPPLAQSDDCLGQPGNPCLPYVKIPSNGTYFIEVTSHAAGDTGLFTIEVAHPRSPDNPDPASLDQRLDATRGIVTGSTIGQDSVVLLAVVTDPDPGDTLHLQAEIEPTPTFTGVPSSNCAGSDSVPSGQTAHVTCKGLANHQQFYWRVRVVDQTNRTSGWVAHGGNPDFAVAISQPPNNVPSANLSQFHADDSVSSYGVGAVVPTDTIVLAGQVSDPDPGDLVRLLVEVKPVSGAGSTFTGVATDSSDQYTGNGAGSFAKVRVGPLPNNTNYHWQAWAEDQTGRVSVAKTSFGSNAEGSTDFRIQVAHPPDLPQTLGQFQTDLTPLAAGDTANQGSVVFQGTVSDVDGGNVSMNVEVQPIDSAFKDSASGTSTAVPSGQVASLTLSSQLTNNKCYHWQARAVDNTSRTSNWQSFGTNAETSADFCVQLPVSQLVFTQQPPLSTPAGVNMTPVIQVTARNSLNQTVTSFSGQVTITLAANPGNGTLGGTLTQNAVSGTATFNDLHINKAASGYKLLASALSFTATSTSFSIVAGPVAQLAITAQPTSAAANATIMPAVQVSAWDAESNFVNTFTGQVQLAITPGTGNPLGVLIGGGPFNASSGIATFSGLSINKTGANYTLTASSGALIRDTSQAFSITGGPIASLTFVGGQPSNTTAGAAISPPVQVTALDAGGNVASFTNNIKVAIGASPSGDTVSGTTTVPANGVAVFNNLHIRKAGNNYTLVATVPGNPAIPTATSTPFNIQTGAANQLIFAVQPTQTADSAIIDSVTGVKVTAYDSTGLNIATSFGNQVGIGITPGTGPGGVGLLGTTTATPSGGIATFGDLRIHKLGTGYGLTATASGVPPGTSTLFDIVVGPAKALFFTVEPPLQTVANVAMNPAVQVTARDAAGNKVIAFTNQVNLTITAGPGGANLSGGAQNAVAGVATFSNLSIDKAGTPYALTASSGALTQDVSTNFTILAGGPDGPHSSISPTSPITACRNSCAGGSLSTVTVTARDLANNPVAGATVTISSSSPSAVVTQPASVTNSSGVATGTISDTTAGSQTVSATIQLNPNPPVSPTAAPLTVNPSTPAAVFFIRNPLNTTAGATINNPGTGIQVQINDQFGNKNNVSNSVGLEVLIPPSPSGTLAGSPNPKPATNGVATFSNLSIALAGSNYFLRAFSPGLASDTSTPFNITNGTATKLAFVQGPTSTTGGATIAPVIVEVEDANGNRVLGATNSITVAIGINPSNGNLGGTKTVPAVNGQATFSTLSIDSAGSGYTLTAAATGLTGATSGGFNISVGPPAKLAYLQAPTSTTGGATIAPPVTVRILDAGGNVTTSTATVAVSITAGTGDPAATLSGTKSVAAINGTATFGNLSIDSAATGYKLDAASSGLTGVTSSPFDITAGAAAKLSFGTQPASTTGGATMAAVTVRVLDAGGNLTNSGANVTLAITGGTGTANAHLSGGASVTVAANNGTATFNSLNVDSVGSAYTLSASSAGLTGATSIPFNITVGVAAKLAFGVQPSTQNSATTISPAVTVRILDAGGNLTSSGASVTVSITSGSGTSGAHLLGTTAAGATSGTASFNTLSIDSAGSSYTLRATSSGLTNATSMPFNIQVGPATKLGFKTPPSSTTGGATLSTVQVEIRDAGGNRVTSGSRTIVLALTTNPNSGTLSGTTSVASASGLANFTTLSIDSAGSGYVMTATASGGPPLTSVASSQFDITVGAAAQLIFLVQPADPQSDGVTVTPPVEVIVADLGGNRVTTSTATIAIDFGIGHNPGGNTLGGTISKQAASGHVSFDDLVITGPGSGYTLVATSSGLTGTGDSNPFTVN